MKNFSFKFFFVFTSVWLIITLVTFGAAIEQDEGTLGSNFFLNLVANVFYLLRFPFHLLLYKWILTQPIVYCMGLAGNSVIYGIILERLTNLFLKDENDEE